METIEVDKEDLIKLLHIARCYAIISIPIESLLKIELNSLNELEHKYLSNNTDPETII